jgi:SAM-dependent methyltransferase
MSETWSDGYVTDMVYTYGYYREISPVFQRFCLLLRGLACDDPGEGATHCELGFGQGVSVNIHAAANPGRYVATDFNPAHAAHASGLARASGCDIRLYDASFEQLLARDDLPAFDSISLHGIWTWVSRDNHRVIAELASRHLKPGGIFYVSYNCFPGWSAAHPLRQIFAIHDRYAAKSAGTAQRIDAAIGFTEALIAAGPLFARATPGIEERLKTIKGERRGYLAHEYFNRDWNCMYFSEVADAMAAAKLDFAASASPLDAVDALNLTAEGTAFLKGIEHPILRDQIRDYFVNQQFRKDIYQRGVRRLSQGELRDQLLATRIALMQRAETTPLTVKGALHEATLQAGAYRPLLDAMAARDYAPKSLEELMRALSAWPLQRLTEAAAVLVGAGLAAPCQTEPAVEQARKTCKALNLHLQERARVRGEIDHLASPVTGGGIAVGRFQQLFLLARSGGSRLPAEWSSFAWQVLAKQGERVIKEGRPLETPEQNLAELTAQANAFAERLPVLQALETA